VIGVVLSGCDGDGTAGLKAIEEADGIGVVQDPDEAAIAEMPEHALLHNSPHYVARIEGMAALLGHWSRDTAFSAGSTRAERRRWV
jgi:chemotaxis response regulator CheB